MEQIAHRIPFDVHAIRLGDFISPAQCDRQIDYPRGTTKHQFALLALKDKLEHDLSDLWGRDIWLKQDKGGLCVLDDHELAEYARLMDQRRARNHRRSVRMLISAETSGFSQEQRQAHDRQLELQTRLLSVDRSTRRQHRLKTRKNQLTKGTT